MIISSCTYRYSILLYYLARAGGRGGRQGFWPVLFSEGWADSVWCKPPITSCWYIYWVYLKRRIKIFLYINAGCFREIECVGQSLLLSKQLNPPSRRPTLFFNFRLQITYNQSWWNTEEPEDQGHLILQKPFIRLIHECTDSATKFA